MTRTHRARLPLPLLALVAVAALVAACTGGKPTAGGSNAPEGNPVPGGRLVYGISADAAGFNPVTDQFSAQSYTMAGTIIEPLVDVDATGQWRPMLAKAMKPNEDYTSWTITVRPGITFSNGEKLTPQVVKQNLDAQKKSPLTSAVFAKVKAVTVSGADAVRVDLAGPWVAFPYTLASQVGMIEPTASLNNPKQASRHPVGTGPFTFARYIPGNRLLVVRNPHYWRKGLPYLSRIEFHILTDSQTRAQTLESGGIDMMMANRDDDILKFGKMAGYQIFRTSGMAVPEVAFMLNTAKAPFNDLSLRQALAYATDRQAIIKTLRSGLTTPADGPWMPGSKWYVPGGYPDYNLAKAKSLVAAYEKAHGPVRIQLLSLPDPSTMENVQLVQDMWKKAGIDVTIKQADQPDIISSALTGNYQATIWSQFTEPDPDGDYVWLHSSFAQPVGKISINMSRVRDPQMDAALDEGRSNPDEATRKAAYATVQRRLRADLPFIWIDHLTTNAVIAGPKVHGLRQYTFPDGSIGKPMMSGVVPPLYDVWMQG